MRAAGLVPDGRHRDDPARPTTRRPLQDRPSAGTVTGTAPTRTMTLPNLNRRTMIVDFDRPGTARWSQRQQHDHADQGPAARRTTTMSAGHAARARPSTAGAHPRYQHRPPEPVAPLPHDQRGGDHDHPVYDPGHRHEGRTGTAMRHRSSPGSSSPGTPRRQEQARRPVQRLLAHLHGGADPLDDEGDHGHQHRRQRQRTATRITSGGGHDHAVTCRRFDGCSRTTRSPSWMSAAAQSIDITPLNFTVYAYIRAYDRVRRLPLRARRPGPHRHVGGAVR